MPYTLFDKPEIIQMIMKTLHKGHYIGSKHSIFQKLEMLLDSRWTELDRECQVMFLHLYLDNQIEPKKLKRKFELLSDDIFFSYS